MLSETEIRDLIKQVNEALIKMPKDSALRICWEVYKQALKDVLKGKNG